jgi:ribosomal protein S27E
MPMVRCPECDVRQYAATPYVFTCECVGCGRPLFPQRTARSNVAELVPRARARENRIQRFVPFRGRDA